MRSPLGSPEGEGWGEGLPESRRVPAPAGKAPRSWGAQVLRVVRVIQVTRQHPAPPEPAGRQPPWPDRGRAPSGMQQRFGASMNESYDG